MVDKSSCIFLMLAFLLLVHGLGNKHHTTTQEKEIIELNAELTRLNIKKLKGECNEL